MENNKKYMDAFMEIFEVEEFQLNEKFTFKDMEKWDSLRHLTLITQLEDVFEIVFETDDILHFDSYENGKKILKKYGVAIEE